jgi:hypothetical protein
MAKSDRIPIRAARTIEGCGPTKKVNKMTPTIEKRIEIFLGRDEVKTPIRLQRIVMFIPERTTRWRSPTRLTAS